jgi:hypothetical protein
LLALDGTTARLAAGAPDAAASTFTIPRIGPWSAVLVSVSGAG